jgi:hypothetical protein
MCMCVCVCVFMFMCGCAGRRGSEEAGSSAHGSHHSGAHGSYEERLRLEYEARIAELERERGTIAEEKQQVRQ